MDNRHETLEIQTVARNLAAEALRADTCLFSTNGGTTGVHAAMSAVAGPGEKIAISRNVHESVVTRPDSHPRRPSPARGRARRWARGRARVMPETLERALAEHPDCEAVLIVSPSYYSICSRGAPRSGSKGSGAPSNAPRGPVAAATAIAIQQSVTDCWKEPLEEDGTMVVMALDWNAPRGRGLPGRGRRCIGRLSIQTPFSRPGADKADGRSRLIAENGKPGASRRRKARGLTRVR